MTTQEPAPDGVPLWLRIALGAAPIAAAMIAGSFLLANTVGRRIERLKNLADARDKLPSWMNVGNSIDRLVLHEITGIERARSPLYRWYRRVYWFLFAMYITIWGLLWFPGMPEAIGVPRLTFMLAAIVPMLIFIVLTSLTRKRRHKVEYPNDVRLQVLEILEEERLKASEATQSETAEPALESETSNDDSADTKKLETD